jgi:hypothetical protein
MRRIPSLMLWLILGVAIVVVPIACSSSSNTTDAGPDAMTRT